MDSEVQSILKVIVFVLVLNRKNILILQTRRRELKLNEINISALYIINSIFHTNYEILIRAMILTCKSYLHFQKEGFRFSCIL